MKVLINGDEHTWESDFISVVNQKGQQVWKKKREDYFSMQKIGQTFCFIKRSENGFRSCRRMLIKMIGERLSGVPDVYGFAIVIEHGKKVSYLITEYIKGAVLEEYVNNNKNVILTRFAEDVLNGLNTLNSYNYWHSDVNAENIYIADTGRTYIIDIDSCFHNSIRPTFDPVAEGGLTTASNQMAAYILKTYKRSHNLNLKFSDLSGVNLNYGQALFLIYQLKYFNYLERNDAKPLWRRSTFKALELEKMLLSINSNMPIYFSFGLNRNWTKTIVQKISYDIIYSSTSAFVKIPDSTQIKTCASSLRVNTSKNNLICEILTFKSDKLKIIKNKHVTISWSMKNMKNFNISPGDISDISHGFFGQQKLKLSKGGNFKLKAIGTDNKVYEKTLYVEIIKKKLSPVWLVSAAGAIGYIIYEFLTA